jgi:hypothetical protein
MGQFPDKALTVLRSVSLRIERWWREEKRYEAMQLPSVGSYFSEKISEEICNSAAKMGNSLNFLLCLFSLFCFLCLYWYCNLSFLSKYIL